MVYFGLIAERRIPRKGNVIEGDNENEVQVFLCP